MWHLEPTSSSTNADEIPQSPLSRRRSWQRKFARRRAATKIDIATAASFARQADFQVQHCMVVCGGSFAQLRVLILAGSSASSDDVQEIVQSSPSLLKLDVSHCNLQMVPSSKAWEAMLSLSVLFLHRNMLHRWEDLRSTLAAPNLEWLTIFENPLASQPDVRGFIIAEASWSIRAIDLMLVTDLERLEFATPFPRSGDESAGSEAPASHCCSEDRGQADQRICRFQTGSSAGILLIESKPQAVARPPQELLSETKLQLLMLKRQSLRCSASCLIQCFWRGHKARLEVKQMRRFMHHKVIDVQKNARAFIWKQRLISNMKDLLAEQGELELLLSAKEMLTIKARRLIERNLRRWVQMRKVRRRTREAAICLSRSFRGHHARSRTLEKFLQLSSSKTFYFPAEYIWEFRVLLNVTLERFDLDLVPNDQSFEPSNFLALRIPHPQDLPSRNSTLEKVINFRNKCVMRPCRSGRYPQHVWDGPFHHFVDGNAPAHIRRAYSVVSRRAANVPNLCRRAFLDSCVPGRHPIEKVMPTLERDSSTSPGLFFLQRLLDSPESSWPEGKGLNGQHLKLVLREARRQGARPCNWRSGGDGAGNMSSGYGARFDSKTGLKVYRDAVWLASPLLRYRCPSAKVAQSLFLLLIQFEGTGGDAPLIRPVPFLVEKMAMQAAAATTIQATFRAWRARRLLGCGLLTALVFRRAALCVQRSWRWSILRRRLHLLSGALKYIRSITTKDLFIEERLFTSLNFINSIDRYPPFIAERSLHFGYSSIVGDIVFIREELRGATGLRDRFQGSSDDQFSHTMGTNGKRAVDVPAWLRAQMPSFAETCPEDASLVPTLGLQGLLHEGLGKPAENDAIAVNMASIEHLARLAGADGGYSCHAPISAPPKAIPASLGMFRFVNLKFPSVAHARRRALALFLGTWSSRHRIAVPLLAKPMLQSNSVCEEILRLWDIYGLTWAFGDRITVFQMRQRYCHVARECVSVCGQDSSINLNGREYTGDSKRPATIGLTTFDSPKATSHSDLASPIKTTSSSSTGRESLIDATGSANSSLQGTSKLAPLKESGMQRRFVACQTPLHLLSPRGAHKNGFTRRTFLRTSQIHSQDAGTLTGLVKSSQLPALQEQTSGLPPTKPHVEGNTPETSSPTSGRSVVSSHLKLKAMRRK